MMRSLWTAASGMLSQQTNLDTIANNLSNINTVGFKRETNEFKSLLYQTLQEESTDSDGNPKMTSIQVGSGVRNSAITTQYTQGAFNATEGQFDLALEGRGFFMLRDTQGNVGYTRNGAFQLSMGVNGRTLANSQGFSVLNQNGEEILIRDDWNVKDIAVNEAGQVIRNRELVRVLDANGNVVQTEDINGNIIDEQGAITTARANNPRLNGTDNTRYTLKSESTFDVIAHLGIAQFNNPSGLRKGGGTMAYETPASGEARIEGVDTAISRTAVKAGYLEASTVQAVDEMVNMIVAQRAYELNSKVITASDEMLQQANQLRRG